MKAHQGQMCYAYDRWEVIFMLLKTVRGRRGSVSRNSLYIQMSHNGWDIPNSHIIENKRSLLPLPFSNGKRLHQLFPHTPVLFYLHKCLLLWVKNQPIKKITEQHHKEHSKDFIHANQRVQQMSWCNKMLIYS